MSGDEIAALSLADVGEKIAKKEISSLEATEAALDRIERYGEKLHAVVHCDQDAARKPKRGRLQQRPSRMHGCPAHKDRIPCRLDGGVRVNILDGLCRM